MSRRASNIHQPELMDYLRSQFRCDWFGVHGPAHWGRVTKTGLLLAKREGAREDVVRLFALLHDHRRLNEDDDKGHGARAARAALALRGRFFDIDDHGMELLQEAITHHSDGLITHSDITVMVCWDADRLDLGRVGKVPDPRYLCTASARDRKIRGAAFRRSIL